MKLSVFSVFMLLFILEVNSQNLLSDLLERINNKDTGSVQDGPDDLDAILEDTRLKMIRLMRRSPAEKNVESWNGRWFPQAVTEPPRRKVSPTYIEDTKNVESWTGRWFPQAVTEPPRRKVSPTNIDETKNVESWTGRWFPQAVTEPPRRKVSPTNIEDTKNVESWTGRWFPQAVTEPPRRKVSPTNIEDTKNVESWTGRWFPQAVTEPPRRKVSPTNIEDTKSSEESWTGRWLPERITERPRPKPNMVMSSNNMWQMINSTCDDGHTNLTVDWDYSPINYTCYNPAQMFYPDPNVRGIIERDYIPAAYSARHVCMSSSIDYYNTVTTFGPHRPAWPKYGEYRFVPRQRWIHNLEHGAVVMLYHPCAHPLLVQKLRKIVKNCLYRHIITPYTLLSQDRPLALVTWGWAYLMPDIDLDSTMKFIQEHALKGPEHTHNNGQYDDMLLEHAEVVSSIDDNDLCPIDRFQK